LIKSSGRFDTSFYLSRYPEVGASGRDPIWDYVTSGEASSRNPRPDFDRRYYSSTNVEVGKWGMDPLAHYICFGEAQGRRTQSVVQPSPAGKRAALASNSVATMMKHMQARASDTAAVVHLFYPGLWNEIRSYLRSIEGPVDLFVSVPSRSILDEIAPAICAAYPSAAIRVVENRGRDVAPFVELLSSGTLSNYRYVCKIHTKKSMHRSDGMMWRLESLRDLLGSPEHVRRIKSLFDSTPRVGIVGPSRFRTRQDICWNTSEGHIDELCGAMGIAKEDIFSDFFAGTMFWFRPGALKLLGDLNLHTGLFEPERGQTDQTLAHALERVFTIAARGAGYRIAETELFDTLIDPLVTSTDLRTKFIAMYRYAPDKYKGTHITADVTEIEGGTEFDGICYDYHWLSEHRDLQPTTGAIAMGPSNLPFCVCWRIQTATADETMAKASPADDLAYRVIGDLIPLLRDRRYLRYKRRAVLVVENFASTPALRSMMRCWRDACRAAGVGEVHICIIHEAARQVRTESALLIQHAANADVDAVIAFPGSLNGEFCSSRLETADEASLPPGIVLHRGLLPDEAAKQNQKLPTCPELVFVRTPHGSLENWLGRRV
jgi:hypothetical protein